MFPFITKTWNPIAGGPCPFNCYKGGCWATLLKDKKGPSWDNLRKKYTGPWRIDEKQINKRFSRDGDFVFVQDMPDIGAPGIPDKVIEAVIDNIDANPESKFLMLTKNPEFYNEWIWDIPDNVVVGATIETNAEITKEVSFAPQPEERIDKMIWVSSNREHLKYFVSIEPIQDFKPGFSEMLGRIEPLFGVAVGYDNYDNHLREPAIHDTERLIQELERFTTVYRKTIRKAWNEGEWDFESYIKQHLYWSKSDEEANHIQELLNKCKSCTKNTPCWSCAVSQELKRCRN